MPAVRFVDGQVLFVDGIVAMSDACCCEESSSDDSSASGWSGSGSGFSGLRLARSHQQTADATGYGTFKPVPSTSCARASRRLADAVSKLHQTGQSR